MIVGGHLIAAPRRPPVRRARLTRRVAVLATGIVVAGLALAGCSTSEQAGKDPASTPPSSPAAVTRGATPSSSGPVGKAAAAGLGPKSQLGVASAPRRFTPVAASVPTRVAIPSIGVRSGLQPLGLLKDGSLAPPTKWQVAGWYAGGVLPGQVGPAVIAGHVDSTRGPAIFFRLRDVKVGNRVIVTERSGKSLTFVVDHINEYRKSRFPTSVVYGPTPDPQLRVVTCTGDFDASKRSYVDNLVVSAHLVS